MTQRWPSAVPHWSDPVFEPRASHVAPEPESEARVARPPIADCEIGLDDFKRYFRHTPAALCIKECARLSAIRRYPCPGPILDVGCGDGLFARIAFDDAEVWGIDIDAAEGRWAAASQAYSQVVLGDVTRASLPQAFFQTCVANCSLEHVPRIDLALKNIFNSLRPGGTAYLFVPNAEWASHLTSARLSTRLGLPSVGKFIQKAIDRQFRHHHLYDADGWRRVVAGSGLRVVDVEPVLSTATTVAFEAFLLPSLAGLLNKKLTTRWTNFPPARGLFAEPTYRAVKALMDRADRTATAEFLVIARRAEV
jgi:SAM-dependent methyltransferase